MRRRVGSDRRLTLDEATHLAGSISRRRFLQIGGVLGGGVLLGACSGSGRPPSTPTSAPLPLDEADEPRVAIVGAGLAGLAAAYWLTRAGIPVSVYESRDRVGGRCWSARGFDGGQVAEHGGEFVDSRHVHIAGLARELGLELDDLWGTWVAGSRWPTFVDGEIVPSRDLFEPLDEAAKELARVAGQLGPWWAGRAGADARAFDEMSMADWFDANVPGGIGSPLGRAFSLEQSGWYGLDPDRLSAMSLLDYYAVEYPGADERYTVHGGNDRVPDLIAESLPAGNMHLETPLRALRRGKAAGTTELAFDGMSSPVVADRVILALPFTALRRVDLADSGVSAAKRRAIEQLGMGTNAKLLLQLSSDPHSLAGWSGGMDRVDEPAFTTWESSSTDGSSADASLITVYSGGRAGDGYDPPEPHGPPTEEVIAETLSAMDAVVPGVADAFNGRAWLDSWVDDPWAGGSYAAYLPGQFTRFAGLTGIPEGSIHFAGEHTSSFSQGFLNGGVESGERAAIEVLEALGRPVPPTLDRTMKAARRYRPRYPW